MAKNVAQLPQGFILEETAGIDGQVPAPPPGFTIESSLLGGKEAAFVAPKPKGPLGQISEWIGNITRAPAEQRIATAQNIYAISKISGIPLKDVAENIKELQRDPRVTGITPTQLSNEEYTALVFAPFIGAGLMTAPATTAISLAGFSALDKMVNLSDFVPTDANDATKTAVELLDIGVKGGIVGGGMKLGINKAPGFIEKYFQTKMQEMNLPSRFTLTRNQVADIFKTGKLTTTEQKDIFKGLNLNRNQLKDAVRQGLNIEIPGELIIRMADKPGWAAFKKVLNIEPLAKTFPKDPVLTAIGTRRTTTTPLTPLQQRGLKRLPLLPGKPQTANVESDIKGVIEGLGGKLLQIQPADKSMYGEPAIWYNTPSGSTQVVLVSKYTPDLIREKIASFEEKFQEKARNKMTTIDTLKQSLPHLEAKGNLGAVERLKKRIETLEKSISKEERFYIDKFRAKQTQPQQLTESEIKVRQLAESIRAFESSGNMVAAEKLRKRLEQLQEGAPAGVASTGEFVEEIKPGEATVSIKPIETIEMIKLAKDLIGDKIISKKFKDPGLRGVFYPKGSGSIAISTDLFKRGNEKQLAATLAHEIGHLVDYLPQQSLARGNVYGRLLTIKNFTKEVFGGSPLKNKDLHDQLYKLSKEWRPFDETTAHPRFLAYRKSSKEVYADFISTILNNPELAQKRAPEAFSLFFEYLDRKPAVKEAYFKMQALMDGKPEMLLEDRYRNIREMFARGEELREQKRLEKELAEVNYLERLRQMVDDINYPIIAKEQKLMGKGIVPSKTSPIYELEERSMVDNNVFLMVHDINQKVLKQLAESGIEEEDFAVYSFLKRIEGRPELPIAGDIQSPAEGVADIGPEEMEAMRKKFFDVPGRKDIANPLGFSPKTAAIQMKHLKDKLGNDKFIQLERIARDFHDIIWPIIEDAVRVGSYNKNMFENTIVPNKGYYVSFGVLDYLQDYVPATVKMQKGTLKEIESPVTTTILKMISLIRLNARQRAANSVRDWLKTNFSDEIKPARRGPGGSFIEPAKGSGKSLIYMLEDGRMAAYEVDQYIAKSVENSKDGDVLLAGHMINNVFANNLFKNLYITYNPGFMAFNIMRDFKRNYANLNALGQKVTIGKLLSEYMKALPEAKKRQQGILEDSVREMMETGAIDIPFIDFNFDLHNDAYHGTLKQLGILESGQKTQQKLLRPLIQILEGIRFVGSTTESMSKIAGYNILKKSKKYSEKEIAYLTRNYVGTPNFRRQGTVTSVTNAVFMFSNIMKEGLKTDFHMGTNPKTAGGWLWAQFKTNIVPKLVMFLAAAGYLGNELKKMFDGISEYDKTNYIIIPVGEDENGKTIYVRLPHDEAGRLMSAMFWKILNGLQKKEPEAIQQIFAFGAGQMPGLTPGIEIMGGWVQYLSGRNPYDAFRGQYLISDKAWKAGGWPVLKKMVQWTANNTGQLHFSTYSDSNKTTFEAAVQTMPLINRLLKVSDYGITERLRKTREKIEQRQAKLTLKKRDLLSKGVDDLRAGKSKDVIVEDIAKKLYESPTKRQKDDIRKGLQQEDVRGQNVYLDMIMTARTNEEKELIIAEMYQMYDAKEMRKMERTIIETRAATTNTVQRARKLGLGVKNER
jgi:hypothetical protein